MCLTLLNNVRETNNNKLSHWTIIKLMRVITTFVTMPLINVDIFYVSRKDMVKEFAF